MLKSHVANPEDNRATHRHVLLPTALIAITAAERPLRLLAANLNTGISFSKLLIHAAGVFACGWTLAKLGERFGLPRLVAAFMASLLCLVAVNWHEIVSGAGWWVLGCLLVAVPIAIKLEHSFLAGTMFVVAFALGASPLVQLVTEITERGDVIVAEPDPIAATYSGRAEDVVVIFLDEYMGLAALSEFLDYNSDQFATELRREDFTVPDVAWSTATSTFLSIPEMLEMSPLIADGAVISTGNDQVLYRVMGGDNRFVEALRGAGYTYTHVESGWNGTDCGDAVDVCISAPWVDPTAWELWRPSIGGEFLRGAVVDPLVHGALAAASELPELLHVMQTNDRPDLIIAHVLLPHNPFVLAPDCSVRDRRERRMESQVSLYLDQLQCTESITLQMVNAISDETAAFITSDHGTSTDPRTSLEPTEWSDTAITEKLSVFMTYRLPSDCETPTDHVTTVVMATVLSCAADVEALEIDTSFTVTMSQNVPERLPAYRVPSSRMDKVRTLIRPGTSGRWSSADIARSTGGPLR